MKRYLRSLVLLMIAFGAVIAGKIYMDGISRGLGDVESAKETLRQFELQQERYDAAWEANKEQQSNDLHIEVSTGSETEQDTSF